MTILMSFIHRSTLYAIYPAIGQNATMIQMVWPMILCSQGWQLSIFSALTTVKVCIRIFILKSIQIVHPKNYGNCPCFIVLLWFGTGQYYPFLSRLLHWHWGNRMIAPVPVKQPWMVWVQKLHKSLNNCDMVAQNSGYIWWDATKAPNALTHTQVKCKCPN